MFLAHTGSSFCHSHAFEAQHSQGFFFGCFVYYVTLLNCFLQIGSVMQALDSAGGLQSLKVFELLLNVCFSFVFLLAGVWRACRMVVEAWRRSGGLEKAMVCSARHPAHVRHFFWLLILLFCFIVLGFAGILTLREPEWRQDAFRWKVHEFWQAVQS